MYLGDGIVHVECGHLERAGLQHLLERVHAGRRLLAQASDACSAVTVTRTVTVTLDAPVVRLCSTAYKYNLRLHTGEIFGVLRVDEDSEVAAVVEDHVERLSVREHKSLHTTNNTRNNVMASWQLTNDWQLRYALQN